MYKAITYIPVLITFGVIAFLFVYYSFCFLYPSIIGDFYGTLGITDIRMTERLVEAGKVIGLPLVDHVVVSDGGSYSFCAHGRIR